MSDFDYLSGLEAIAKDPDGFVMAMQTHDYKALILSQIYRLGESVANHFRKPIFYDKPQNYDEIQINLD